MSTEGMSVSEMVNTVSYSRKISDGNYGSREFTIFVQFHGDIVGDPDRWESNCRAASAAAQMTVAQHLNLQVEIDSENFIREVLEQTFPGAQLVANTPAPAAPQQSSGERVTNQYGDVMLGVHNGQQIWAKNGKFGPYVTNGNKAEGGKNANVKPPLSLASVTLADAVRLLGL